MADLSTVLLSETVVSPGGTLCWMSPELLDPSRFGSNGRPTLESDCYALGMVVYEVSWLSSSWHPSFTRPQVLTGLRPFQHMFAYMPVSAILRGERPEKPSGAESLGFSDTLWGLVRSCWSESSSARPTARQLLSYLSLVTPSWVPPPVYPVIATDTDEVTGSHSSGLSGMLLGDSTRETPDQ